ncbi:MAG: hypothetical protein AABW58_02590 [Nanoarchaeota archaeon]
MQLKRLSLAAIVLALAPCASTTQTIDTKINSFYSKKEIKESNNNGTKTFYTLNNGIEVEVVQKTPNSKPIAIKILKDPNNLLIRNTLKFDSAEGSIYELDSNGTRRFAFDFNKIRVHSTFVNERGKTTVHYSSGGVQGDLPDIFVEKALAKLAEIEKDLCVNSLLAY